MAQDFEILDGNVLAYGVARVSVQRLGLSHWAAGAVLRSWASAPLVLLGQKDLLAPVHASEAIWIGLWADGDGAEASAELFDPAAQARASITWPQEFQLTAIHQPPQALRIELGQPMREFHLTITSVNASGASERAGLTLRLLRPGDWASRAGRPAPAVAREPPLPSRLG